MPVGDIYTVVPRMAQGTQIGINVLHYRTTASAAPEPSPNDIAIFFAPILGPLYIPLIASTAAFGAVLVQKIFPLPKSLTAESLLGAGGGSGGPEVLPTQSSGIITKQTAFAGRKFRGRIYIPFPSETSNAVGGVPTAAYGANATTLAAALLLPRTVVAGGGSVTLMPVLFHRVGTPNFTDILQMRVNAKWATQRRRGAYGALNIAT